MNAATRRRATALAALVAMVALALAGPALAQRGQGGPPAGAPGQGQGTPAGAPAQGSVLSTYLASLPLQSLDDREKQALLFAWEEEKLARDVYRALFAAHGHRAFANIAAAEQRHMDEVALLLTRYQLANPSAQSAAGVFADARLQSLYSDLVARGKGTLVDALEAGATVEDLDLSDVTRLLGQTDNRDVATVLQNLAKGSRNHLRAFVRQLTANGASYSARYLPAEKVAEIVAAAHERRVVYDEAGKPLPMPAAGTCGNGAGHGRGGPRGRGHGNGPGAGNGPGDGTGPRCPNA